MWNMDGGKTAAENYTSKVAVSYLFDQLNHSSRMSNCTNERTEMPAPALQRCHYTKGKVKNICPLE